MHTNELLLTELRGGVDPSASQWLDDALGRAATGGLDDLLTAYTVASRRIGNAPLGVLRSVPGLVLERWTREDAARALLLLRRSETAPGSFVADAIACYEQGDTREQESWLRAVGALPGPERFLATVVDACRSSILTIFEAVVCENPYPAAHFPERNFNQMVLKALFSGVSLARIVGLQGRLNPELTRMAADYAAERRAAGRSVPADIGMAMQERGDNQEQPR